jgi:hypothetical protein
MVQQGTGAKDVGALAMRFAERNVASCFEFAQKLAHAKHSQEIMALHADYVKSQVSAFGDQAGGMTEQAAKLTDESARH